MSAVQAPVGTAPVAIRQDPAGRRGGVGAGRAVTGLAGAWLAFVVAHRLLSGRWWLWLAPELIPPLAFVAVPGLLFVLAVVAGRFHARVALLAVAGLLLGGDLAGLNLAVLRTPPSAPPDAVRLVSWNTTVWNATDDADVFYGSLTARHADIYLLQEYKPDNDPARRDADLARLRREFPGYQVVLRGELVTVTRFPVVAVVALPADPPAGSDWRTDYWEVKSLRTDLRVRGRIVSVYNTHVLVPLDLSSPLRELFYRRRHEFFQRRETQYRALAADLDRNPNPVLVAGDLNTSPAMADLRRLTDRLTDAGRASGSAYPTSWTIGGRRWWRLDWTFVSSDWTVHRYRLRDARGMSDHQVQDVVLSLSGAR
ncbi:endonuclease/exonuclease/phosphatase family protein [Micromonospora yasonensis]|uniref:endonuclease/exonuclease/phosphatase family protein n=1 Tax=Micromonospora yasonensis TaxID=1128667 RepID=UPI00223053C7|nr:endonuclease/exonuclease/phosphatase family protein [Micromonospora yasonensis]MCW3840456.1 endonuclease/exonuclease/phosphatase family protein [Micromonospora yasonensis]